MHDLRHCFEAPTVLVDPCTMFVADPDEPGVCTGCGWLGEDHHEVGSVPVAA